MLGISGSYSGSVSWLAFVIWVQVFGFMFVCVFGSVAFLMIAGECSLVGTGLFVWQNQCRISVNLLPIYTRGSTAVCSLSQNYRGESWLHRPGEVLG